MVAVRTNSNHGDSGVGEVRRDRDRLCQRGVPRAGVGLLQALQEAAPITHLDPVAS